MKTLFIIVLIVFCSALSAQQIKDKRQSEILKSLNLSDKDMEMIRMACEMLDESLECMKEAGKARTKVMELNKIMEVSGDFRDIHAKAKKRALRYTSYIISLQVDAIECMEIRNGVLLSVYEKHYSDVKETTGKVAGSEFHVSNSEVAELIREARAIRDKVDRKFNIYDHIDDLLTANDLELKAISIYEGYYADVFNVRQSANNDIYYALSFEKQDKSGQPSYTDIELLTIIADNNENRDEIIENDDPIIVPEVSRPANIIYKVQVGAFCNPVNESVFNGLNPVSKDDDDEFFTKYMVGQYSSYKAACNAKEMIIFGTEYKDAFIVAYVDGKRVPLNETVIRMEQDYQQEIMVRNE